MMNLNKEKSSIEHKNSKKKKGKFSSQDSNEQATLQSIKSGDFLVGKSLSPAEVGLKNRSSGTAMSGLSM